MIELRLKPREERRLRAGHLWVYSNELQIDERFKQIAPGRLCRIADSRGKPLGVGYVNPHSLLTVRLLSGAADARIDADWFARRIETALALRERIYPTPHYRLIHGEGDGLPGLVADRYGDVLVLQFGTAGIEAQREAIVAAFERVLEPRGIVLRNDVGVRELEGLPAVVEVLGDVPDSVELVESGVRFEVAMRGGQKTGWFYDQRDNRDRLARYVRGARVLDVFSYVGAWALRAAGAGAASVACIDASAAALASAHRNAALNGVELARHQGEALDVLRQLRRDGAQFDVVIVDPPALIKRRKDTAAGTEHYAALNRAAMQLLSGDGMLVSCSCSHHLAEEELLRVLLRESRHCSRRLQVLERGGQGPDHPVHPAIPETRYLKAYYARLLSA
jgi:23S rRNA (cytosine1962-C5)-methyltransferase